MSAAEEKDVHDEETTKTGNKSRENNTVQIRRRSTRKKKVLMKVQYGGEGEEGINMEPKA